MRIRWPVSRHVPISLWWSLTAFMMTSADHQRCRLPFPDGPCGWMAMAILYSSHSLSRLSKLSGVGSALRYFRPMRLAEVEELLVRVVVLGEALTRRSPTGVTSYSLHSVEDAP